MAKTVSISEDGIIAMLKGLPESVLADIFSKTLMRSETSPLTAEEQTSYEEALKEHARSETINWEDLK